MNQYIHNDINLYKFILHPHIKNTLTIILYILVNAVFSARINYFIYSISITLILITLAYHLSGEGS